MRLEAAPEGDWIWPCGEVWTTDREVHHVHARCASEIHAFSSQPSLNLRHCGVFLLLDSSGILGLVPKTAHTPRVQGYLAHKKPLPPRSLR